MNANWRTNLGGALGALGSTLVGVGVVPQLAGTPSKVLTVIATVGFIISAMGKFFTALFAADAATVSNRVNDLQNQLNAVKSDTTTAVKP